MDFFAGGFQIVPAHGGGVADVPVADKLSTLVIMSRREGQDLFAQPHQVFGLAGKEDLSVAVIAIVQGTNTDGIPGGNQLAGLSVIEDHGKFRVQPGEHFRAELLIQGKQDFTVGVTDEGIAVCDQRLFQAAEAVDLAVAHNGPFAPDKGLHSPLVQPHNGQPVKAEEAVFQRKHPAHIRASGNGCVEIISNRLAGKFISDIADDGTHGSSSFF